MLLAEQPNWTRRIVLAVIVALSEFTKRMVPTNSRLSPVLLDRITDQSVTELGSCLMKPAGPLTIVESFNFFFLIFFTYNRYNGQGQSWVTDSDYCRKLWFYQMYPSKDHLPSNCFLKVRCESGLTRHSALRYRLSISRFNYKFPFAITKHNPVNFSWQYWTRKLLTYGQSKRSYQKLFKQ